MRIASTRPATPTAAAFTYLLWAKRGDTFAAFAPVAAAAGLYFADAKPKPLFHAASEKDPLVTFAMQQRTLDRVKKLNGCDDQGEEWAKVGIAYRNDFERRSQDEV